MKLNTAPNGTALSDQALTGKRAERLGVGEADDVPYRNYPESSAAWLLYIPSTICRWPNNKTNPIGSVDVEESGANTQDFTFIFALLVKVGI